ncbi:Hypothetical protein NTJ_16115 [Nesidiocoris tenuis]|uniref:Uncharacterized protein n=1 Tax=Nesidiocoris tenuis TaxID=355587 RepID=A0ABN7BG40_9HEMI|nr:Hypothetical protein NTJ_16115 [Nesidiocoris tenuis]
MNFGIFYLVLLVSFTLLCLVPADAQLDGGSIEKSDATSATKPSIVQTRKKGCGGKKGKKNKFSYYG